jgi:hypothetical protein
MDVPKSGGHDPRYISLSQAAKFCNYSQDYLNLRARQKKLKALKMGRNWVTTREWLDEYSRQMEELKELTSTRSDKIADAGLSDLTNDII